MAATFVTASELKTNLGIGTLYADSIVEEVCQASEDKINAMLWYNTYPIVGVSISNNFGYAVLSTPSAYTVGQTVTITRAGSVYNGSHVITATYPTANGLSASFPWFSIYPFSMFNFPRQYSIIQFALTQADDPYHLIEPYGKVSVNYADQFTEYSTTPLVREAAMMIAVDIWQARQQSSAGGISPDFSPSPYRMGNSLMGRVRGLLSDYISPRSMVG